VLAFILHNVKMSTHSKGWFETASTHLAFRSKNNSIFRPVLDPNFPSIFRIITLSTVSGLAKPGDRTIFVRNGQEKVGLLKLRGAYCLFENSNGNLPALLTDRAAGQIRPSQSVLCDQRCSPGHPSRDANCFGFCVKLRPSLAVQYDRF
jgi:hypothetical protein